MPEVDVNDLFEATTCVYRKWSEEFDNLKAVKKEKFDGSEDWHDFHEERLRRATASEAKWKALLQRLTSLCPRLT